MKMPIPNDWDGVSECDYVVRWPDSTYWRIILRGVLSNPSLVAFWDATTGDVEQVIADFEPFLDFVLNELECGDMKIPIGSIFIFAGSVLPENWLWCDGTEYETADYPELFSAIERTYGGSVPADTFRVPDLLGRVPVGQDAAQAEFSPLGDTGGAKIHTLTTSQMPSHTHVQNSHNHTQNSHNHTQNSHNHTQDPHSHTIYGLALAASGSARVTLTAASQADNTTSQAATATNQAATATNQAATATNQAATATNQNEGGGQAHNNLQPYIVLNYMIKAR